MLIAKIAGNSSPILFPVAKTILQKISAKIKFFTEKFSRTLQIEINLLISVKNMLISLKWIYVP